MDSLVFLIESKLNSLPESERKVAEYILKEKKNAMHQRISEIASQTGASSSAVMRLCKTLGIPGFQELKIMLARDIFGYKDTVYNPANGKQKKNRFPGTDHIIKIIESNIKSLQDLISCIDTTAIEKAANLIEEASFCFSFGIGLSGNIAFDFYHKIGRLGYLCGFASDSAMQIIIANTMKKGMTGFVVSHSGMTADVLKTVKIIKANKASVIAITGNANSDIADLSDVVLLVPFSEPIQRLGASSTRIVQLTIIDILFSELIRRNPSDSLDSLKKTGGDLQSMIKG